VRRNKRNLLTHILGAWLSIGAAQAWEFQLPIKLEDEKPVIKSHRQPHPLK